MSDRTNDMSFPLPNVFKVRKFGGYGQTDQRSVWPLLF